MAAGAPHTVLMPLQPLQVRCRPFLVAQLTVKSLAGLVSSHPVHSCMQHNGPPVCRAHHNNSVARIRPFYCPHLLTGRLSSPNPGGVMQGVLLALSLLQAELPVALHLSHPQHLVGQGWPGSAAALRAISRSVNDMLRPLPPPCAALWCPNR